MDEKLLRGMGDLPLKGRVNYCRDNVKMWVEGMLEDTYGSTDAARCVAYWNIELTQAEGELYRRRQERNEPRIGPCKETVREIE